MMASYQLPDEMTHRHRQLIIEVHTVSNKNNSKPALMHRLAMPGLPDICYLSELMDCWWF